MKDKELDIKGLIISEDEFMSLPSKKQMCVLYQNQVITVKNQVAILDLVKSYRIHQKATYIFISLIGVALGVLWEMIKGSI